MNKQLKSQIKEKVIVLLYLTKFQNGFYHFCFINVLNTDRGQSRSKRNRHGCSGVAVFFITRVSIATVAVPIAPPRVEYTALVLALQFTICQLLSTDEGRAIQIIIIGKIHEMGIINPGYSCWIGNFQHLNFGHLYKGYFYLFTTHHRMLGNLNAVT